MSCLSKGLLRSSALLSILLALTAGPIGVPSRAFALSELKPAQNTESEPKAESEQPQQAQPAEPDEIEGDSEGIPLPDPLVDRSAGQANQQSAKPDNTPEMSVESSTTFPRRQNPCASFASRSSTPPRQAISKSCGPSSPPGRTSSASTAMTAKTRLQR
jgi:hypothetical protein